MAPPLPVPSKAAIHALRGLALGTSCAIGVIVEDRRRRISTLKTAVENKKKLKSSRHYHGTVERANIPQNADDVVLSNGDDLPWHRRRNSSHDPDNHPPFLSSAPRGSSSAEATRHAADHAQVPDIALPGLHILPDAHDHPNQFPIPQASNLVAQEPSASRTNAPPYNSPHRTSGVRLPMRNTTAWGPKLMNSTTDPAPKPTDPISIAEEINAIMSSQDADILDRVLPKFLFRPATSYIHYTGRDAWFDISVRLSKECQAQGRWEDAYRVIKRLVEIGPVSESLYYAHDPFPLIESYLPAPGSDTACSREAFSRASKLFLTAFEEQPRTNSAEVERVGKRLLQEAISLKAFVSFHTIYRRVSCQIEDHSACFTGWVIEKLSECHDYKYVVKYFLLNFSKLAPDDALFDETADRVVTAVETMQGLKATQVLRAFAGMRKDSDGVLKTAWIMRLLQSHWKRHRDFAQSRAVFEEVRSHGLLDKVYHPYRVYGVMVELAIRADENDMANSYYDELVRLYPHMTWDIPLKGYFALSKAKANDWDGVYEDFVAMHWRRHKQPKDYIDAFVGVLKVFAGSHPVAEVRDFVERDIRDLHITMHRYVVTLVANKYGEGHDFPGFLAWIQYCGESGFSMDPTFCNAVLHNCRSRWKFDFEQLKRTVSTMRQINPGATDDTTERILSQASRAGTTRSSMAPKVMQIRHRAVAVNKLAYVGRSTNKRDVYEAMNQEIGFGKHGAAIAIYKRAMRFGMPFCGYCFRLAITAALDHPASGPGPAFNLIQGAHEQGQDVTAAVSAFIRVQMDRFRAGTSDVLQHIQNLITRFEALHIVIDAAVLTHAALVCVRLGQHAKAISLCQLAGERSGAGGDPCFSRQCFRVLLLAHTQLVDARGTERLLTALLGSDFAPEKKTLLALKDALKQVRAHERAGAYARSHNHDAAPRDHDATRRRYDPAAAAAAAVQRLLRRAVDNVKKLRAARLDEGRTISSEALRIMSDAAAEFEESKQWIGPPGRGEGWGEELELIEDEESMEDEEPTEDEGHEARDVDTAQEGGGSNPDDAPPPPLSHFRSAVERTDDEQEEEPR